MKPSSVKFIFKLCVLLIISINSAQCLDIFSPQKSTDIYISSVNQTAENYITAKELLLSAQIGDIIEEKNVVTFPFNQWAIYLGNGTVIELSTNIVSADLCSLTNVTKGVVVSAKLDDTVRYRISNRLPATKRSEDVVMCAKRFRDQTIKFDLINYNSEHFVNYCKYGKSFSEASEAVQKIYLHSNRTLDLCEVHKRKAALSSVFYVNLFYLVQGLTGGERIPWLPADTVIQSAQLFDIIEIRRGGLYMHLGMYIGNGYIQHFTTAEFDLLKTISEDMEGIIERKKLKDVTGDDLCRVNNKKKTALVMHLKQRNETDIKSILDLWLHKRLHYNIYVSNCEHLVTFWRYGSSFSDQMDAIKVIVGKSYANLHLLLFKPQRLLDKKTFLTYRVLQKILSYSALHKDNHR